MTILETITIQKQAEIKYLKIIKPISLLEQSPYFGANCHSFKSALLNINSSGIIAEFKRRSPSKGVINAEADAAAITSGYVDAGAACLSVLTDQVFFGAKDDDFKVVRKANQCPILRKEFILDEYQIIESKSMGADAILLIASILSPKQIEQFAQFAQRLGMEVLLETHTEKEIIENLNTSADMLGINNRNLDTFEVDILNGIRLAGLLPKSIIKIAESGIRSAESIRELKNNGFNGFLIGEYFMRELDPARKCSELIKKLRDEN